ncbi:MAG: MerR family transcriptional regulator [Candidatus Latescibacteria bacterium]|nr:MerR family transcriptional regulator [Candidatus Latescibacterota bacterium]
MDELTIQQVEAATGLTGHTLRYYEKAELMITQVKRADNGHRRYSQDDLYWLNFITRLRETGMAIAHIRRYAELVRQGEGTTAQRLELLETHRQKVLDQLGKTQAHLVQIENKITHYKDMHRADFARANAAVGATA